MRKQPFLTTAIATAAVIQQPMVQHLLHLAYLTAAFAVLFACGILIAHSLYKYVQTGWAEKHAWAIRRAYEYLEPVNGSFWIDGWAGRLLSVLEGRSDSVRYF